jgi:hypothetical protein
VSYIPNGEDFKVPYDDVRSSFKLAMERVMYEGATLTSAILFSIITEVDDYVANHYGDD